MLDSNETVNKKFIFTFRFLLRLKELQFRFSLCVVYGFHVMFYFQQHQLFI